VRLYAGLSGRHFERENARWELRTLMPRCLNAEWYLLHGCAATKLQYFIMSSQLFSPLSGAEYNQLLTPRDGEEKKSVRNQVSIQVDAVPILASRGPRRREVPAAAHWAVTEPALAQAAPAIPLLNLPDALASGSASHSELVAYSSAAAAQSSLTAGAIKEDQYDPFVSYEIGRLLGHKPAVPILKGRANQSAIDAVADHFVADSAVAGVSVTGHVLAPGMYQRRVRSDRDAETRQKQEHQRALADTKRKARAAERAARSQGTGSRIAIAGGGPDARARRKRLPMPGAQGVDMEQFQELERAVGSPSVLVPCVPMPDEAAVELVPMLISTQIITPAVAGAHKPIAGVVGITEDRTARPAPLNLLPGPSPNQHHQRDVWRWMIKPPEGDLVSYGPHTIYGAKHVFAHRSAMDVQLVSTITSGDVVHISDDMDYAEQTKAPNGCWAYCYDYIECMSQNEIAIAVLRHGELHVFHKMPHSASGSLFGGEVRYQTTSMYQATYHTSNTHAHYTGSNLLWLRKGFYPYDVLDNGVAGRQRQIGHITWHTESKHGDLWYTIFRKCIVAPMAAVHDDSISDLMNEQHFGFINTENMRKLVPSTEEIALDTTAVHMSRSHAISFGEHLVMFAPPSWSWRDAVTAGSHGGQGDVWFVEKSLITAAASVVNSKQRLAVQWTVLTAAARAKFRNTRSSEQELDRTLPIACAIGYVMNVPHEINVHTTIIEPQLDMIAKLNRLIRMEKVTYKPTVMQGLMLMYVCVMISLVYNLWQQYGIYNPDSVFVAVATAAILPIVLSWHWIGGGLVAWACLMSLWSLFTTPTYAYFRSGVDRRSGATWRTLMKWIGDQFGRRYTKPRDTTVYAVAPGCSINDGNRSFLIARQNNGAQLRVPVPTVDVDVITDRTDSFTGEVDAVLTVRRPQAVVDAATMATAGGVTLPITALETKLDVSEAKDTGWANDQDVLLDTGSWMYPACHMLTEFDTAPDYKPLTEVLDTSVYKCFSTPVLPNVTFSQAVKNVDPSVSYSLRDPLKGHEMDPQIEPAPSNNVLVPYSACSDVGRPLINSTDPLTFAIAFMSRLGKPRVDLALVPALFKAFKDTRYDLLFTDKYSTNGNVVATDGGIRPVPFPTWNAKFSKSQGLTQAEAAAFVLRGGRPSDVPVKTDSEGHVKLEVFLQGDADSDRHWHKRPRLISAMDPAYNAVTGPWTMAAQGRTKQVFNVNHVVHYAARSGIDVGKAMSIFLTRAHVTSLTPVHISSEDTVDWDGSYSKGMRELHIDHDALLGRDELGVSLMRKTVVYVCTNKKTGDTYTVSCARRSGEDITSWGASVDNAAMTIAAYNIALPGLVDWTRSIIFVMGDDVLSIIVLLDGKVAPDGWRNVYRLYKSGLGFNNEIHYSNGISSLSQHKFCSSRFIRGYEPIAMEEQYVLTPMFGKMLCKLGWFVNPNPDTLERVALGDVIGRRVQMNHVPFMRRIFDHLIYVYKSGGTRPMVREQLRHHVVRDSLKFMDCANTWVDIHEAYQLHENDFEPLVEDYTKRKDLSMRTHNFVLAHMAVMDQCAKSTVLL
jgi:hypothetical protein